MALDPIKCQCQLAQSSMMHLGTNISYYKHIGMIRSNGLLYSAPLASSGYHFIAKLLESLESDEAIQYRLPAGALTYVLMRYTFNRHFVVLLKGMRNDLSIISCLRRIQRAVVGFLRKKRQERLLCLAMGLHPRLGDRSSLHCLCSDVFNACCHVLHFWLI